MDKFMKIAYDEAVKGVEIGDGGPFGAVIVRDGEVIAAEHNRVLQTNDPTMHAEVSAIRAATAKLKRFSLQDCVIYSTCMPCPMCLGAIIWAKIPTLIYGASASDAANAGFDDEFIYSLIKNGIDSSVRLSVRVLDEVGCRTLFDRWKRKKDQKMY